MIPPIRRFQTDRSGVSAVVGAVMVLAVVTMLLVMIRVEWAPVWEGEAEAAHVVDSDAQMERIWSETLRLSTSPDNTVAAQPVRLAPPRASLLVDLPGQQHGLFFEPDEGQIRITTPSATIWQRNGSSQAVANNDWQTFPSTVTIPEVDTISDLRLRIDEIRKELDTRKVVLTLRDVDGGFAGSLTVEVDLQSPDMFVVLTSRNSANEVVTVEYRGMHSSTVLSPYYVNVLDPGLAMDQIINDANGPFSVQIAYDPGFDTDYTIMYERSTGGSSAVPTGSGGPVIPNFNVTTTQGRLRYSAPNQFYPTQQIDVSHGAVMLIQEDGVVFRNPPAVTLSVVGNVTYVGWTMPQLTGEERRVVGDLVANVFMTSGQSQSLIAGGPEWTFSVDTEHPAVWAVWWRELLESKGLSDAGSEPQFTVNPRLDGVDVTLYGVDGSPTGTASDVVLELRQAVIQVALRT